MAKAGGFTILEVMIALVIAAILYSVGAPLLTRWTGDMRIRVSTEAIQTGILLARTEAIRQNTLVRFQLTDTLDESCTLVAAGPHWVVSQDDPSGNCGDAPSATTAPRIIQIRSGQEGGARTTVSATGGGAARTTLVFNGAGRVSGTNMIDRIDISGADGSTCQHSGGEARCMRIRILNGGDSKICDPKVTDASDIRLCP